MEILQVRQLPMNEETTKLFSFLDLSFSRLLRLLIILTLSTCLEFFPLLLAVDVNLCGRETSKDIMVKEKFFI